ncbi:alpha/beta hydrolase family esterase [Mucilaginibacter antarcticus]|uniref:alpha/beta hydrolase family esterase n=1 Tax=Mucilaginibacter antarcticus TaxID=1855725 RepID=UPI00366ADD1C
MLFIITSLQSFPQDKGREVKGQLTIDGNKRSFLTYIPNTTKPGKVPLVLSLHGGFASPKGMFKLANFKPVADKGQFIVICPASKRIWHDGNDDSGIDDVKFIGKLIDYAIDNYNIDPKRVYVTGISNGGFMTARLACQLNERIAGIAIVAATLDIGEGYDLKRPMPALYIHGTKDPIVSYDGGKLFGRKIYSHDAIVQKWVTLDGCLPDPVLTELPDVADDGTSILKAEYQNPKNGMKVLSYTVFNGGHTWPNGKQYLPTFIIGKTSRNLDACQEIWNFFKQYKLGH